MKELADGVFQLDGTPSNGINVYLMGDVLLDAGTVFDKGRILKQIKGRELSAHALTHAHIDHFGASKAVCEEHGIPFWCGAEDAEAVEAGKMVGPGGMMLPCCPALPVAKRLVEGDEVAGFKVLDTPGPFPRPRLLLARVRQDAALRRRDVGLQPLHAARRHPRAVPGRSARIRSSTASRPAGWPRSSPRWSASGTARHCATRRSSPRPSRSSG